MGILDEIIKEVEKAETGFASAHFHTSDGSYYTASTFSRLDGGVVRLLATRRTIGATGVTNVHDDNPVTVLISEDALVAAVFVPARAT